MPAYPYLISRRGCVGVYAWRTASLAKNIQVFPPPSMSALKANATCGPAGKLRTAVDCYVITIINCQAACLALAEISGK